MPATWLGQAAIHGERRRRPAHLQRALCSEPAGIPLQHRSELSWARALEPRLQSSQAALPRHRTSLSQSWAEGSGDRADCDISKGYYLRCKKTTQGLP